MESPRQIADADEVAATVGGAFTLTTTVELFKQPFASVPTTVYVVAVVGESVTDGPESDTGIQV